MSDVALQEQPQPAATQEQTNEQELAFNQALADNLWNGTAVQQSEEVVVTTEAAPAADQPSVVHTTTSEPEAETVDLDEYFKREFGIDAASAKIEWETLRKLKEAPPATQELSFANDDSKRFFDYLKEGKEDDVYNFLNQKKQLEKLEKLEVTDANQAAEIIKANLQFKYNHLSQGEIDRLFTRQYSMPKQPSQALDQTDEDYAAVVEEWKQQVQEKHQDMIIDAKLAKPELIKFKSQIVLPDIQKPQEQPQGPSQEDLAKLEAGRKAYLGALETGYQNFKGYSVTAKDGEVQLPISYAISPEELTGTKQALESFNINDFFDQRWFDGNSNPNITAMQEDLYLLQNRDKVFQKIANEAAAQMKAQMIKVQNNINLKGVNQNFGPTPSSQDAPRNENQILADKIWSM